MEPEDAVVALRCCIAHELNLVAAETLRDEVELGRPLEAHERLGVRTGIVEVIVGRHIVLAQTGEQDAVNIVGHFDEVPCDHVADGGVGQDPFHVDGGGATTQV